MRLTLAFILIFTSEIIYSQQAEYFDAPFGGGIGYVPAWYIPGLDPINSELQVLGMPELSSSGFYSSGGAGFIYIGFIKNLRLGGMGFGGSLSSAQIGGTINREVVYSLSGGGLSIEYTLPVPRTLFTHAHYRIGARRITYYLEANPYMT